MITDQPTRPPVDTPEHDAPDAFGARVARLRIGRAGVVLDQRLLLVAGGTLAALGLLCVLLGYLGASGTPYLFEQVSYLISGGLFGLALVFLGGFLYFAHWLTQLLHEQRSQSAAVLAALERLHADLSDPRALVVGNGHRPTNGDQPPAAIDGLVATAHGTMAHRPHCAVVAGKAGLRQVAPGERLRTCKLCGPDDAAASGDGA